MKDEQYELLDLQGTALACDMVICQIENGNLESLLPRMLASVEAGMSLENHVLPSLAAMLAVVLKEYEPDRYHEFLAHVVAAVAEEVADQ